MANSKLPHERLREWADSSERLSVYPSSCMLSDMAPDDVCPDKTTERIAFRELADEIERYYIPRPRFEDGEPVQFGDEPEWLEPVDEMTFYEDGSAALGHVGNTFSVSPGKRVKRPAPKVLDADGVPIEAKNWMYDLFAGDRVMVLAVLPNGNVSVDTYDDAVSDYVYIVDPSRLPLGEPDSLEKLLDDMRGYDYGGVSCVEDDMTAFADRLTALIERGEE